MCIIHSGQRGVKRVVANVKSAVINAKEGLCQYLFISSQLRPLPDSTTCVNSILPFFYFLHLLSFHSFSFPSFLLYSLHSPRFLLMGTHKRSFSLAQIIIDVKLLPVQKLYGVGNPFFRVGRDVYTYHSLLNNRTRGNGFGLS